MKKSLIVTLALVFVLGIAGTAFAAANPFSDVPAKHWAYDAVSQLAKAGIVEGYGDGTFKGDKTMTRYEMAIVAAKAMAKSDKATAAQKAMIDKLSVEFATELNNLGVRVAKLEANQPNLKLTGTVDVRYTSIDYANLSKASAAQGQYRLRMDGVAKIDDKTMLGMRLTNTVPKAGSTYKYLGSTFTTFGNEVNGDSTTGNALALDRLFMVRTIGTVKTTLGMQMLKMGTTNIIIDSGAYSFAGFKFEGKSGIVNLSSQWGRMEKVAANNKVDVASIEASSKIGKLEYGAGYATLKDGWNTTAHPEAYIAKYTILNAKYTFDKKISLQTEYVKNRALTTTDGNKTAYVAIATYGKQALVKQNDQNIQFVYFNTGKNALTRWNVMGDYLTTGSAIDDIKNTKAWSAQYNYAFSPTFVGYVQYIKTTDKDNNNGSSTDAGFKLIRAGVTAKF